MFLGPKQRNKKVRTVGNGNVSFGDHSERTDGEHFRATGQKTRGGKRQVQQPANQAQMKDGSLKVKWVFEIKKCPPTEPLRGILPVAGDFIFQNGTDIRYPSRWLIGSSISSSNPQAPRPLYPPHRTAPHSCCKQQMKCNLKLAALITCVEVLF